LKMQKCRMVEAREDICRFVRLEYINSNFSNR
jgi:hypothetical protein